VAAAPAGGFVPRAREAPASRPPALGPAARKGWTWWERRAAEAAPIGGAKSAPFRAGKHGAGDRKAAVERRTATRLRTKGAARR